MWVTARVNNGTAHHTRNGNVTTLMYGNIPARLLIIHHTYRPLVLTISDVGMACGVPDLVASGYRAANPTGALRREVPRAEILATPLMLAQRRRRAARRRSAALARTDALGDLLLSRLRKLGLFLGVLALELLEIDLFDCDVDVFEVLRGVLDEYRQLALLDLGGQHGLEVLHLKDVEVVPLLGAQEVLVVEVLDLLVLLLVLLKLLTFLDLGVQDFLLLLPVRNLDRFLGEKFLGDGDLGHDRVLRERRGPHVVEEALAF